MLPTTDLTQEDKLQRIPDLLFMVLVSFVLGIIGGWLNKAVVAVVGTGVLLGIFNAYNQVLKKNDGIKRGLLVGGLLGTGVGAVGWLLGGAIEAPIDGLLFGLGRGALIGAIVGAITRANSDESDSQQTKLLIFGGSILFGTVLGSAVGLMAGFILGVIGDDRLAIMRAAIVGTLLGAAIGSYFGERRWLIVGILGGAGVGAVSYLIGGAWAGAILGAISGSFAPIFLVSSIGAFGGLTSRGLKAMVVEALEAPTEMLEQGAVPFLAPALIIGAIIGAVAAGPASLIVLAVTFALLGLLFGILGEINGGISSQITARSMVETAMLGADDWPLMKVIRQLRKGERKALLITAVGVTFALLVSMVGILLGRLLSSLLAGV